MTDAARDPWSWYQDWQVEEEVASEPRTCCECGRAIPAGAYVVHGSGVRVEPGGPVDVETARRHFFTCQRCDRIGMAYCCGLWPVGELASTVERLCGLTLDEARL